MFTYNQTGHETRFSTPARNIVNVQVEIYVEVTDTSVPISAAVAWTDGEENPNTASICRFPSTLMLNSPVHSSPLSGCLSIVYTHFQVLSRPCCMGPSFCLGKYFQVFESLFTR